MGCYGFDYKTWTWKKNPYIFRPPALGPGLYKHGWVDMADFASFQVAVQTSHTVPTKLLSVFHMVCWWRMGFGCPTGPASTSTILCDNSFSSVFDVDSNAGAGGITDSGTTLDRAGLNASQYIARNREAAMRRGVSIVLY